MTHTVAKVQKCWTMSGRMDKGLNVLNVVVQDGQRSQCVERCYVELVSDAQLTLLVSGCPTRVSISAMYKYIVKPNTMGY